MPTLKANRFVPQKPSSPGELSCNVALLTLPSPNTNDEPARQPDENRDRQTGAALLRFLPDRVRLGLPGPRPIRPAADARAFRRQDLRIARDRDSEPRRRTCPLPRAGSVARQAFLSARARTICNLGFGDVRTSRCRLSV